MLDLLRLALRNLWRHKRRTWLTASAIAFSAMLLVFMQTIQYGAYDMMIDTSLHVYTGQMQVQRVGYRDKPQMRTVVPEAARLAETLRRATGLDAIAVRAQGFALASSAERSYGVPVIVVEGELRRWQLGCAHGDSRLHLHLRRMVRRLRRDRPLQPHHGRDQERHRHLHPEQLPALGREGRDR